MGTRKCQAGRDMEMYDMKTPACTPEKKCRHMYRWGESRGYSYYRDYYEDYPGFVRFGNIDTPSTRSTNTGWLQLGYKNSRDKSRYNERLLERWILPISPQSQIYAGTVPVWIAYFYNQYCVKHFRAHKRYNAKMCRDSSNGWWKTMNIDRTLVGLCYWNGTQLC